MLILTQNKKQIIDCDSFFVVEGKTQTIGYDPYYRKFSIVGEKDNKFVNLGIYDTRENAYCVKADLESHKKHNPEDLFEMPESIHN